MADVDTSAEALERVLALLPPDYEVVGLCRALSAERDGANRLAEAADDERERAWAAQRDAEDAADRIIAERDRLAAERDALKADLLACVKHVSEEGRLRGIAEADRDRLAAEVGRLRAETAALVEAAGVEMKKAADRCARDCWTLNPSTNGYQVAEAIRALPLPTPNLDAIRAQARTDGAVDATKKFDAGNIILSEFFGSPLYHDLSGVFVDGPGFQELQPFLDGWLWGVRAQAVEDETLNPWKRAIVEAMICWHMLPAEGEEPKAALNRLIDYEQRVALDPAVSKGAADLSAQARREGMEAVARWHEEQAADLRRAWPRYDASGFPVGGPHFSRADTEIRADQHDRYAAAIRAAMDKEAGE